MSYKLVNGFILGLVLVLMVDFLVFIGLKLHYFDALGIAEYFNVYFFDHQPFVLLGVCSLALGFGMLYTRFAKKIQWAYLVVLGLSGLSLVEPVGMALGEQFFLKPDQQFRIGTSVFRADLLYEGRHAIYVQRADIANTIRILKTDVTWIQEDF
ncbi:MAG: hypothetical protein IBX45_01820 [Campylobacterales bacterium]|nr:hypothetical protein [Campylobacterales bacterium]